ncbi:MAG: TetR/AcrR family transcriptional regulator [Alphaproteobacteria bacterium]|nr:TetR/AcrR family transcriptional regulator [Alphaproteobacteria bacterium]MCB9695966.1 TetR/AcrR family transcriptional regulator [Alphaproteobacteria bacterium]
MGVRDEQRERTRAALLDAARRRFEVDGFEATHLRDVAGDVGLSVGAVFVHFADKRDLLHTALFEDLERALDEALASGPEALEPFLDHVAAAILGYYERRPALSSVLLRESLLAEGVWGERFAAQHARVHAAVVARFEAARARGEVGGDAGLFALSFVSFHTFALLGWVRGALPDPRGTVGRLVRQQLAGARP